MLKEIEVRRQQITTQDGKKFYAYRAKQKDGNYITMKFTRECGEPQSDSDTFVIIIDTNNMNVSRKKFYPEIWVKHFEGCKPFAKPNETEEMF